MESDIWFGDFFPVRNEPGDPLVHYGVAIEVDRDIVGVTTRGLTETYGPTALQTIFGGGEFVAADGDRVRLLGPFQDTGQGNGDDSDPRLRN